MDLFRVIFLGLSVITRFLIKKKKRKIRSKWEVVDVTPEARGWHDERTGLHKPRNAGGQKLKKERHGKKFSPRVSRSSLLR